MTEEQIFFSIIVTTLGICVLIYIIIECNIQSSVKRSHEFNNKPVKLSCYMCGATDVFLLQIDKNVEFCQDCNDIIRSYRKG